MDIKTQRARITGPVVYLSDRGRRQNIPIGPCLVERRDSETIDIVWGANGQRSVALPAQDIETARRLGHLVVLD